MAGALLRSGQLSGYHALGAVGKPVFSAASQLRAAIRRSADQPTADVFAIPKQSDQGDLIDWYAPNSGNVVPWSAAAPDERRAAKSALLRTQASLAALSERFQGEDASSERQVFGKLLRLATEIPSDEHVYIVDGRPVITFWGFHSHDAPADLDVIGSLDVGDGSHEEPQAAIPAAAAALPPEPDRVPDVVAADVAERRSWWRWPWLLIPLLLLPLLLLGLLVGLRGCGVEVPMAGWLPKLSIPGLTGSVDVGLPDLRPALDLSGRAVVDASGRPVWIDPDGKTVIVDSDGKASPVDVPVPVEPGPLPAGGPAPAEEPAPAATEPAQADVTPPVAPEEPAPEPAPEQVPSPGEAPTPPSLPDGTPGSAPGGAPGGTPLSIPETAARSGDTGFLDGRWRSDTGLQDKAGNPIQLGYEFKGGTGQVKLDRTVGGQRGVCTGPASPTMQGGNLVITQGRIRCADGTTFDAPKVVCTMGAGGRAQCEGANVDGTTFPVEITR